MEDYELTDSTKELINQHLLSAAILIAAVAHLKQKDKAGKAYILHSLRVMFALKDYDEIVQAVGVLHDVVEDTNVTLESIRTAFGDEVADAVDSVTRRVGITKETYVDFIQRAKANKIGRLVKIADLHDNMSSERLALLSAEQQKEQAEVIAGRYTKALKELEAE